ncbi:MAG: Flp pilus assembly complex ATPase component TadA [Candidatus Eisenbacteria bacterium]|uniref:Flp pilus assembly complex ATPase component TadA n=1 Tax=Eiseniibacteriota bacterium TaxID=2212470 RepID=A0A9D6L520_UNCEI|nr:Flp pilus assembly complex ATPase component TadA [Candidatus Eisenbacteria bacterium]MBI3538993.1 Flp pilus assembly complex ATPase component TadA [Candidatus Eisenbacteria bacterium]
MAVSYRLSTRRFGELLLEQGRLTPEQLEHALRSRSDARERLGQTLVRLGLLEERDVCALLAQQFGLPVADADKLSQADLGAVRLIPEHLARQAGLLALHRNGETMDVAMGDPLDVVSLDHLRALTGCTVKVWVARPSDVREAVDEYYQQIRASAKVGEILDKLDLTAGDEGEEIDLATLRQQVEDAPVVRLVNLMFAEAIDGRASDIHVEPARDRITVRFRIDGVLHEMMKPPKNLQMAIVSRIKVLADLDIAVRLLPQDGRLTVHLPDREVDVRVSTLPTAHGEKVVLRLFDKSAFARDISQIGLDGGLLDAFQRSIRQPYGMILISGPTGSGKTTTLYSALNQIKTVHRNLLTVEDPIEYHIEGVNQVHANHKVGMTFARALRAILRQDPDVIMVGEIRDSETADIAVKSALTGHLVLSTVHANDAPGTVTRLVDMGVPRYLVGSAVTLVMAQRLVRRVCDRCKETYIPAPETLAVMGDDAQALQGRPLVRGRGCLACKNTGYQGRTAVFEVLELSRPVRRMVLDGLNEDQIKQKAMSEGLITLRKNGVKKILEGTTTIDEVRAATLADHI